MVFEQDGKRGDIIEYSMPTIIATSATLASGFTEYQQKAEACRQQILARPLGAYWRDPWELINTREEAVEAALVADGSTEGWPTVRQVLRLLREVLTELAAGRSVPKRLMLKLAIPAASLAEHNRPHLEGSAWGALWEPLRVLLMAGGPGARVFRCGYCGRLGAAKRESRQWCSDACRMRHARGGDLMQR